MIPHSDNLRIVLVSPRNPLNIGAAARAISNFGFTSLRVVNAYEVAYREAKSAVNASAILETSQTFSTLPDALADCRLVVGTTSASHRELDHVLERLETAAQPLREGLASGPVALVFGSEKYGLSNDDMSLCHWLLRIPTRDAHASMNLGQAVAVCLYELIRDAEASPLRGPRRLASGSQLTQIDRYLGELVDQSGFVNPLTRDSTTLKLRRMVRRLRITNRDGAVWLGILRQLAWRFRQPQ